MDNRAGAGGIVGIEVTALFRGRAPHIGGYRQPDHTAESHHEGPVRSGEGFRSDHAGHAQPDVAVVHFSLPARSIKELISLAPTAPSPARRQCPSGWCAQASSRCVPRACGLPHRAYRHAAPETPPPQLRSLAPAAYGPTSVSASRTSFATAGFFNAKTLS